MWDDLQQRLFTQTSKLADVATYLERRDHSPLHVCMTHDQYGHMASSTCTNLLI